MCGIAGIIGEKASTESLQQMLDLMVHRGPDGEGVFSEDSVVLGHRRLSIFDLSDAGKQPMCSSDERYWITFNGAIYNFKELRKELISKGYTFKSDTDTEVIVKGYHKWGEEVVSRLRGMFAFAIWDSEKKKLFAARDRLGIKPFYYFHRGNEFYFASELKAITAAVNPEINYRSLYSYFATLTISGSQSVYKNILKLEPGACFTFSNGEFNSRKYWELPVAESVETDHEKVIEAELLNVCISHLEADVEAGAFLSGGIDSSAIVSYASKSAGLKTFSAVFKDFSDLDESEYARKVAEQYKCHHFEKELSIGIGEEFEKIIWHYDEPYAVSSGFSLYHICKVASENVKVILSGDGGDELFAGYPRHYILLNNKLKFLPSVDGLNRFFARSFLSMGKMAADYRPLRGILNLFRNDAQSYYSKTQYTQYLSLAGLFKKEFYMEFIKPAFKEHVSQFENSYKSAAGYDSVNTRLAVDLKTNLVDEMLTKVDRASMAFGLEARVPFLDHKFVEKAMRVPGNQKTDRKQGKVILKKILSDKLPERILNRKKQGFNSSVGHWLNTDLKERLFDWLSEASLKEEGVFDTQAVQLHLKKHFEKKADYSTLLFQLLCFKGWQQVFNH